MGYTNDMNWNASDPSWQQVIRSKISGFYFHPHLTLLDEKRWGPPMRVHSSSRRRQREWVFTGRRRRHLRWAFRLFIASFIALFSLSLFFYPTYVVMQTGAHGAPVPYVHSAFGLVAASTALYVLFIVLGIWIAGWALLWGEPRTPRPRAIVLGSWAIPLSIVYVWVSLAGLLVAGVPRQLITAIALVPALLVSVVAPQLFIWGLLHRLEKKFSRVALGMGFLLVGLWGAGSASGVGLMMPVVEILLPVYFGILVIEYLSVHLRLNGSRF